MLLCRPRSLRRSDTLLWRPATVIGEVGFGYAAKKCQHDAPFACALAVIRWGSPSSTHRPAQQCRQRSGRGRWFRCCMPGLLGFQAILLILTAATGPMPQIRRPVRPHALGRADHHSALIPYSSMIGHHLPISFFCKIFNACGVSLSLGGTSKP